MQLQVASKRAPIKGHPVDSSSDEDEPHHGELRGRHAAGIRASEEGTALLDPRTASPAEAGFPPDRSWDLPQVGEAGAAIDLTQPGASADGAEQLREAPRHGQQPW